MTARTRNRAPNLSMNDWRRLLLACPIPHRGCMPFGDFLMCSSISQTQWCDAAKCPDDYIIGVRHFRYIKRHDMLVRGDFHRWAMNNWRAVLCDDSGQKTKG